MQGRKYFDQVYEGVICEKAPSDHTAERKAKRLLGIPLTRQEQLEITGPLLEKLQLAGKEIDMCHTKHCVGRIMGYKLTPDKTARICFKLYADNPSGRWTKRFIDGGGMYGLSLTSKERYTRDKVLGVEGMRVALCFEGARPGTWFAPIRESESYKGNVVESSVTQACANGSGICPCEVFESTVMAAAPQDSHGEQTTAAAKDSAGGGVPAPSPSSSSPSSPAPPPGSGVPLPNSSSSSFSPNNTPPPPALAPGPAPVQPGNQAEGKSDVPIKSEHKRPNNLSGYNEWKRSQREEERDARNSPAPGPAPAPTQPRRSEAREEALPPRPLVGTHPFAQDVSHNRYVQRGPTAPPSDVAQGFANFVGRPFEDDYRQPFQQNPNGDNGQAWPPRAPYQSPVPQYYQGYAPYQQPRSSLPAPPPPPPLYAPPSHGHAAPVSDPKIAEALEKLPLIMDYISKQQSQQPPVPSPAQVPPPRTEPAPPVSSSREMELQKQLEEATRQLTQEKETNNMTLDVFLNKLATDLDADVPPETRRQVKSLWKSDRAKLLDAFRQTKSGVSASSAKDSKSSAPMAQFKARLEASTSAASKAEKKKNKEKDRANPYAVRREPLQYGEEFVRVPASKITRELTGMKEYFIHPVAYAHIRQAQLNAAGQCPQFDCREVRKDVMSNAEVIDLSKLN